MFFQGFTMVSCLNLSTTLKKAQLSPKFIERDLRHRSEICTPVGKRGESKHLKNYPYDIKITVNLESALPLKTASSNPKLDKMSELQI